MYRIELGVVARFVRETSVEEKISAANSATRLSPASFLALIGGGCGMTH